MNRKNGLASKYDTFIFDWDGTLTRVKLLRELNGIFNPHWAYKKMRSRETIDKYAVGLPRDLNSLKVKVIMRHVRNASLENELVTPLADISIYFFRPKLHNGVRQLLEGLGKRGITLALFSNGAAYRVVRELSYLGVEDYFSAIVSAQDIGTLKPNPLGLKVIMSSLGAKKRRTIYFGDTISDIEAAKYAGVDSGAMSCGFDSKAQLSRGNPDYIFDNVEQLLKSL